MQLSSKIINTSMQIFNQLQHQPFLILNQTTFFSCITSFKYIFFLWVCKWLQPPLLIRYRAKWIEVTFFWQHLRKVLQWAELISFIYSFKVSSLVKDTDSNGFFQNNSVRAFHASVFVKFVGTISTFSLYYVNSCFQQMSSRESIIVSCKYSGLISNFTSNIINQLINCGVSADVHQMYLTMWPTEGSSAGCFINSAARQSQRKGATLGEDCGIFSIH